MSVFVQDIITYMHTLSNLSLWMTVIHRNIRVGVSTFWMHHFPRWRSIAPGWAGKMWTEGDGLQTAHTLYAGTTRWKHWWGNHIKARRLQVSVLTLQPFNRSRQVLFSFKVTSSMFIKYSSYMFCVKFWLFPSRVLWLRCGLCWLPAEGAWAEPETKLLGVFAGFGDVVKVTLIATESVKTQKVIPYLVSDELCQSKQRKIIYL